MRESGHDTTYRLEKPSLNLGTINLQSLLYKHEVDVATAIREVFDDELELEEDFDLHHSFEHRGIRESASFTLACASQDQRRMACSCGFAQDAIDKYCCDESKSLYFDYDTVQEKQSLYESATSFWSLWAGCTSQEQG